MQAFRIAPPCLSSYEAITSTQAVAVPCAAYWPPRAEGYDLECIECNIFGPGTASCSALSTRGLADKRSSAAATSAPCRACPGCCRREIQPLSAQEIGRAHV